MAALTPAQIELANSLTTADLPTKLRCAVCSKLAVNAFRTPCCETAICEKCQSTLPSVCPVCEHSPVSASDCTIYKSLRTTIRVFLKTEEKKREAPRPKTNGSTPTTPAQDTPTPTQTRTPTEQPPADIATVIQPSTEAQNTDPAAPPTAVEPEEPATINPKPSVEPKEDAPSSVQVGEGPVADEESKSIVPIGQEGQGGESVEEIQETDQDGDDKDQSAQPGMGPGFDAVGGNFNMNFGNGDMNQMQMMMAMQNGMNPATFGSFPMMGMMDPMAMQSMMMNGGFGAQGMGMNGMNMNMSMGMNGFNGGGNDWNGQQSWNVGQDNFNPNAPGMGNGDFGNFNAGFRTGFNSGNYGHHNQFNEYRRGHYGYRGRGRGRGFYGGYGRGYHHGYNNPNAGWAGPGSQFSGGKDDQSPPDGPQVAEQMPSNVDEFGRAIRPESNEDGQNVGENGQTEAGGDYDNAAADGTDKLALENSEQVPKENGIQSIQGDPANDKGDVSSRDQHSASQGPSRGSVGPMHIQTTVPDRPLNAPTGPKAMRQGLPNTSLHNLRARGFITDEQSPGSRTSHPPIVASPAEEKQKSRSSSLHSSREKDRHIRERDREHNEEEKSRGRHRDRDRDHSKTHTVSRSRTRSRSRSRDRKESRKHRRHRSASVSDDDRDSGHRRRRHRSRKRSTRDEDEYRGRTKDEKYNERSRSATPVDREHRRSGHRSRRDRDEKRRDRDADRESDHDRHRKSGHRSHRDRDQDRDRDRDREKEREKDRPKDHSRDHDEDRHRRSSKTSSALPTPVEPSDKSFNPPTGPRGSFSIKGASSKPGPSGLEIKGTSSKPSNSSRRENEPSHRASQSSVTAQKPAPNATTKDPHTLEREARDRERLLKEAQRMAVIAGRGAGVKRSRESGDDRGGRRKSRRSEAVNTEDEEDRMRRLEAEREGRRWD